MTADDNKEQVARLKQGLTEAVEEISKMPDWVQREFEEFIRQERNQ